jgi:flagella basal body P-ring formation protein FlgA
MMTIPILLLAASSAQACLSIAEEQIRIADLARVVTSFSNISPTTVIGYAPVPGVRRVFTRDEIRRLGTLHGVDVNPESDVCFEWATRVPEKAQIVTAMRTALAEPDVQIDILETSQAPAPNGEIVFSRAGLARSSGAGPDTPVVWRGYVRYSGQRRFDIWARARVSLPGGSVSVVSPIRAGEIIRADQVQIDPGTTARFDPGAARKLEEVVGNVAKRPLSMGTAVLKAHLEQPKAVSKGEIVTVEVVSGPVCLKLDGTAETAGHIGQTISIRNSQSGKSFSAKVTGTGSARVVARSATGRVSEPGGVE